MRLKKREVCYKKLTGAIERNGEVRRPYRYPSGKKAGKI